MRLYRGYEWREIVTDTSTVAITGLEKLAGSRTLNFGLNRPATMAGRVPSDDQRVNLPFVETGPDAPSLSYNNRLLYAFRREAQPSLAPWECRFAGIIEQIEDAAAGDQPYSTFTVHDPWQYLFARPVMNGTSLVGPNGISWDDTPGNVIAKQIVDATIALHGSVYIDTDTGEFETTDELDINFQQGTSVGAAL